VWEEKRRKRRKRKKERKEKEIGLGFDPIDQTQFLLGFLE
jgi:hypothetical protein